MENARADSVTPDNLAQVSEYVRILLSYEAATQRDVFRTSEDSVLSDELPNPPVVRRGILP